VSLEVGQVITGLEIGPVAHGGHFVARHEGQVIFVRGAITGELVDVRITDRNRKFARGDVTVVRRPSEHRVEPQCPIMGRCGGCDFGHVEVGFSRELKRQVVAELLGHLGGYEFLGDVVAVDPAPFGWRTRMRYHLDGVGNLGMAAHRSREIVPLPTQGCLLAVPSIARPSITMRRSGEVLAVAATSQTVVVADGEATGTVVQQVGDLNFEVDVDGFWQAHSAAAQVLVDEVLAGLEPQAGEVAADLYCGAGLFAGFLAAVGCRVLGVEGDRRATELAAANVPEGQFLAGDVARLIDRLPPVVDLVVLDPPRAGAGAEVLNGLLGRRPRAVAYVACDPAALGRDLAIARGFGYEAESVTAFDLFPLTHHVECVAILKPADKA
jgi:tRNA/tmRNA/rRNA uracil-C5-methylase (TrmA/RlmC/RlmD family)